MPDSKTILIADDHEIIRAGLGQILQDRTDHTIEVADNGVKALQLIRKVKPTIAILDIDMPEITGLEVAQVVHNEGLSVDIIFLTLYRDESLFNQAMDIGVKGYVLKENTVAEIVRCVQVVSEGKHYLSPEISDFLIRRNTNLLSPASDSKGLNSLSKTERKILKMVSSLKTNQTIAEDLHVSIRTVQNHRKNICQKLGLKGAHALLKFAIDNKQLL